MRLLRFLLTLFVLEHQLTAHTQPSKIQINTFYGIQFHPEVRHSVYGNDILRNFALNICGLKAIGQWITSSTCRSKIRETVGDKRVLLGLSGGVDSSVVGVLLQKAIGDQLICIFVDHGLLRKGEADQVMDMLGGKFGLNIVKADAAKRFP